MNLRDELEVIRRDHGRITPRTIVTAATPEDHPLHSRFEWDDRIAGDAHRLHQARALMATVRLHVENRTTGEMMSLRVYHSVSNPTPAYEPIDEIALNPVAREVLVNQMRRDFANFKARYSHLLEYLHLLEEAAAEAIAAEAQAAAAAESKTKAKRQRSKTN